MRPWSFSEAERICEFTTQRKWTSIKFILTVFFIIGIILIIIYNGWWLLFCLLIWIMTPGLGLVRCTSISRIFRGYCIWTRITKFLSYIFCLLSFLLKKLEYILLILRIIHLLEARLNILLFLLLPPPYQYYYHKIGNH